MERAVEHKGPLYAIILLRLVRDMISGHCICIRVEFHHLRPPTHPLRAEEKYGANG